MIGIIDYGMGNLHSVYSACQYLELEAIISADPQQLERCERLILPGVGAFGDMINMLTSSGLYDWLKEQVEICYKPLLGICLGMQALFDRSFEYGEYEGIHFMKGDICPLESLQVHEKGKEVVLTVPQIGWNKLFFSSDFALADELEVDPYVYFDHSYALMHWDPINLKAYAQYGPYIIPAILIQDNVMGCQFHPEKSGPTGLRILEWFGKEFCV